MTIAAVLLAGGSGSRFAADSHKLLADLRGTPVAVWAIADALDAGFDEVMVVTGAVDVVAELNEGFSPNQLRGVDLGRLTVLHNEDWAEGMATSLNVAVDHARDAHHEAIVVGLADQPFVGVDAWRAVRASSSPIAVASYDGARRNPVRLAAMVWPLLPRTGDSGARAVMKSRPDLVEPIPCVGLADDIDTVEDLRRWS
ncbi:MAG: nucleotidyltransferase family protein [Acidimicrobiales bacterium]